MEIIITLICILLFLVGLLLDSLDKTICEHKNIIEGNYCYYCSDCGSEKQFWQYLEQQQRVIKTLESDDKSN